MPRVSLETVRRVNSKLWSHALEQELGIALREACACATFEKLEEAIRRACPKRDDKWVIKSPFGFAARERVLGRGPALEGAQATWCRRQFAYGETLIFQPWLDVKREYGVVMNVLSNGESEMLGISDLQTNGAGTGTGYMLGGPVDAERAKQLEEVARLVGKRLAREGYVGPAGFDALEHAGGLHPLLEINARYTMGFIALKVERALNPTSPIFWSTK
jgi:predicted ATP-grasp superfamily ATP-dependent carboligase